METIEEVEEGQVRAVCPFCSWSETYDSVSGAESGLRPHIQFACEEASEEAQSNPSEYVKKDTSENTATPEANNQEEEEGDGEESDDRSSSSNSQISSSVDYGRALKYVVPVVGAFILLRSFLGSGSGEEEVEQETSSEEEPEEKSGVEDNDHELVRG